jgi:hypothetical protein
MRRLTAILICSLAVSRGSDPRAAANNGNFLLEVPELKLEVLENTAAPIPSSWLNRLELHVLRSPQEVSPGKIIVRINGEAANTIMSTRTTDSAIACDLDLNYRPGFLLHAGRNSIEATAESIYGRPFYAVFLLDVNGEPASLREVQRVTTVTKSGEKPPSIRLISPQGAVENVRELTVTGSIEGGVAPVAVTVAGEAVRVKGPAGSSGERGIEPAGGATSTFTAPVALARGQESIEVVATDAHHNSARLLIPVIQGTRLPSRRWAVIIGVSHYHNAAISLQFADRDAQAMRDFLRDPKGGAVPEANIRYLENEEATAANIRSALFDFLSQPGPDDLAIVYFAGHGMNDYKKSPDNYYLLGYDAELDNLGGTAIRMRELEEAFETTLKANLVTLVDACHSGGIGKVANVTNQRWLKAGFGAHRAIITASEIDETSSEGTQWGGGHGVFTYYLLQGLKGAADVKHDHRITVGELFDFVGPHVKEATGNAQTPSAQAGSERGLVLTQGASTTTAYQLDWFQPFFGGEGQ